APVPGDVTRPIGPCSSYAPRGQGRRDRDFRAIVPAAASPCLARSPGSLSKAEVSTTARFPRDGDCADLRTRSDSANTRRTEVLLGSKPLWLARLLSSDNSVLDGGFRCKDSKHMVWFVVGSCASRSGSCAPPGPSLGWFATPTATGASRMTRQ